MKTDRSLRQQIVAALEEDPSLPAESIAVCVHDEVASLHGCVSTPEQMTRAERIAQSVRGVRALTSDIEVEPGPAPAAFSDGDLARAIRNEFKQKPHLGFDQIFVKVKRRVVTLEGEVNWLYQVRLAEQYVRQTGGAKDIVNLVEARHNRGAAARPVERVAV